MKLSKEAEYDMAVMGPLYIIGGFLLLASGSLIGYLIAEHCW